MSRLIPKMFNIRKTPTDVVGSRDTQLHQDYTIDSDKTADLSESMFQELVALKA